MHDSWASGRLTIDLDALRSNYLRLRDLAAPATAAAVVKADAYGLGAAQVAPVLCAAGCRTFFVAQFGEAIDLRSLLPDDARIFVLNGLQPGAEEACAEAGIVPVLNSLDQIASWKAAARRLDRRLPAALQADTGMSRLGLSSQELDILASEPALLDGIEVSFLMSHLASADEPESPQNADQLAELARTAARFPWDAVSFANSGGILLGSAYHGALARPGIALYGGAPAPGRGNPMRPVVRLEVPVIQTRTVPPGTRIGYGGARVAEREMRLATIAAGYADGLARSLGERGAAYYQGERLPFAGRVSMDSVILDITALPPDTLRCGSLVELIGLSQTLDDLAAAAGTISYEILTSLGRRYTRRYLPAG